MGYVHDPRVAAAHYYSRKVVPCGYPACAGRAVMSVRITSSRSWKDVCRSCREWSCPASSVADDLRMTTWLAEDPAALHAWNLLPNA